MNKKSDQQLWEAVRKKLIQLRKEQALTQEEIEEASGIASAYISYIEHGRRKPTLTTLKKLTKAYGVTLEEFFKGL